MVSVGSLPDGIGSPGTGAGAGAVTAALTTVGNVSPGQTIYIANNVSYAVYIEEGTARIAPRLMLERSINEAFRV